VRRLEVARRGADVLEQKRHALLREQRVFTERLSETEAEWHARAAEAARWNDRALVTAGPRRLRLAALYRRDRATVDIEWRNTLGTVFPATARLRLEEPPDFIALGGGATVVLAERAHVEALRAAMTYAAVRAAFDAITAELAATTRRLRAIERRWIPQHEAALHALELSLDEQQVEDMVRSRWVLEQERRSR
jgi:V/A-type H+-transporting ATPase subunit D